MENISTPVYLLFVLAFLFAVWQFYLASGKSRIVLACIFAWAAIQSGLSLTGFYQQQGMPPRFMFLIIPTLLIPILIVSTKRGQRFSDSLQLKHLTILHFVRVPVEITLYYLFLAKLVPVLMTFEGYNYDILPGLTAPLIFYLVFKKGLSQKVLLIWNVISLAFLFNILWIALLSAKTPFQMIAFDQPNVGVGYFPFVLLPAIIVPLVFLSHLVGIRKIILELKMKKSQQINEPDYNLNKI